MNHLTDKILQYIEGRRDLKMTAFDKAKKDPEQRPALLASFEPKTWLDDAARRASWVVFATHTAKIVHGDSRTTNVFDQQTTQPDFPCLSSLNIEQKTLDIVGNAAGIDVARMLLLDAGEDTLLQQLRDGNYSALEPIAANPEQIKVWVDGLLKTVQPNELRAHHLGKEVYFPVDGGYHMLSPLFPASLHYEIDQRIKRLCFSDANKAAREAMKKSKYSADPVIRTVGGAFLGACESNPPTRGFLNTQSGGRIRLLSCRPPVIRERQKTVAALQSIFMRSELSYQLYQAVELFKEALFSIWKEGTHEQRKGLQRHADGMADALVQFVAQTRASEPGFSLGEYCRLPDEQCLILDPQYAGNGSADEAISMVSDDAAIFIISRLPRRKNAEGQRERASKDLHDFFASRFEAALRDYWRSVNV